MQAYNQAINDLDKELDFLKSQFEVPTQVSLSLFRVLFLNVVVS